jgi:predicted metal-binding membrane protein
MVARGAPQATVAVIVTMAVAAISWAAVMVQMDAMTMSSGNDSLPAFLTMWVSMMAAMMLPSTAPIVMRLVRAGSAVGGWPLTVAALLVVYLVVWATFGVVAYAIQAAAFGSLPAHARQLIAGAAFVAAGVYSFTGFRHACELRCRAMCSDVDTRGMPTIGEAARNGLLYGLNCVGCSAGLMIALLAAGIGSLIWMLLFTGFVLVYKVLPPNPRVEGAIGVILVISGLWFMVLPSSVPAILLPSVHS